MESVLTYVRQNPLEIAGIVATLICVWLNTRQNVWGWFWAIVSSGIYGVIYFQAKLYSDMELQGVFIVLSVYGWYHWLFGGTRRGGRSRGGSARDDLPVTAMPAKFWVPCLLLFAAFTGASGYLHGQYTDARLPYADSALTATSLIAQWQMAKKYLENWVLWILADVCYVGLYLVRGLNGTALLYLLLLGLALKGYLDWRRTLQPIPSA
jgi:nicotinamide mononucleotide transporter